MGNQLVKTNQHQTEGRYLLFSLAHETYGVGIHRVREIMGPVELQPVQDAPPSVKGTVNLRGITIPVVDMRCRLGLEAKPAGTGNCVVTVLAKGWDGPLWMGLLVDGIQEVTQVWSKDLEATPGMEEDPRADWLLGLARCGEKVVLLLDVDQVAKEEEVEAVQFALGGSHEAF